ncbi:hypothetical protein AGMMS49965_11240 [Bacteroidia bacterium]|nr:hypothetical protein AGMMS49965_11240 [Bacteroidia bacterium]
MKKRVMILAATAAITGVMVTGCGSSKPVSVTKVNQEQEISVPCAEYFTDGNFFRGVGVGQSKDMNTAREKARMAANTELAGSISTTIKQVSEKYVNDAGQSQADYGETFEALTKQVINQQLNNLEVCCSKTTRTPDGLYKMYIAVQADAKKVFDALDRSAAADKKLETMYNREKFRANYDAEMAAFAKKQ